MSRLYVMCGVAGSGKSTFISSHMDPITDVRVSRDEIRFSMVTPAEEYFSKEKEVYKEYIKQINQALMNGYNVYADATQLTVKSRHKLLSYISKAVCDDVRCIWMDIPLNVILERNEKRCGTRAYVPKERIHQMYECMEKPNLDEGFNTIYIIHYGAEDKNVEYLDYQ